ncbi:hypothetical protein V3C99_005830 [Haemonchus contortus]
MECFWDHLRVAYTEASRVAQPSVPYRKLWAVYRSVQSTAVGCKRRRDCKCIQTYQEIIRHSSTSHQFFRGATVDFPEYVLTRSLAKVAAVLRYSRIGFPDYPLNSCLKNSFAFPKSQ